MRPVLEALAPDRADEAKWNAWSRQEDKSIRARLQQGDLDSMVNLLLFGTSFTKQPRIRIEEMAEASKSGLLRARLLDFLQGIREPNGNERLVFLRNLIRSEGMDPDTAQTGVFVLNNLERVLKELREFAQRTDRSRLFRDRGVSLDTSIFPSFGIEETLRDLKSHQVLGPGQVTRAAVVGPGLDFVDWDSGYDYYPQQTLQPFALYGSLLRLGLATKTGLGITIFDISPRVLDHVARARQHAGKGDGYVVQLPRDPSRHWTSEAVQYWRDFGNQIGAAVPSIPPPAALRGIETRAVRIRPEIVLALEPVDLNIVLERESPPRERFDLVIATNIFVYYDTLEQTLALQNVAAMLKPGGLLLANSELHELPDGSIDRLGFTELRYAEGQGLGDHIVYYRKRSP